MLLQWLREPSKLLALRRTAQRQDVMAGRETEPPMMAGARDETICADASLAANR